jgi:cold shock CspA family protein
MAKSSQSWNKREREKQKQKERQEKADKKADRKQQGSSRGNLEDMMAYIDENGNITATPPDPMKKREVKLEDIVIGVPKQSEMEAEDPVRIGTVAFFNQAKGFGFIKDRLSQESVFVHINNILEPIQEGNRVSFEVEMGHKGPSAVRVKIDKS